MIFFNAKRAKTPLFIQMEAVECGAASLGMILGYFGRHVPIEQLRLDCGISRDGSKASNIVKAAEHHGLDVTVSKVLSQDIQQLIPPLILFWNSNHFLVYEGQDGNHVILNDPASGHRKVPVETFRSYYSGIAFSFQKNALFKPLSTQSSLLTQLWDYLSPYKVLMGYLFCTLFLLTLSALILPSLVRIYIDYIIIGGLHWTFFIICALIATLLFQFGLLRLQNHLVYKITIALTVTKSSLFFRQLLKLPLRFFYQRSRGDISKRISLNQQLATQLSRLTLTMFTTLLSLMFHIMAMIFYQPQLTIVTLGLSLFNLGLFFILTKRHAFLNDRIMAANHALHAVSTTGVESLESIKGMGTEADVFSSWAGYHAKSLNYAQETSVNDHIHVMGPYLLTIVNTAIIFGGGSFFIIKGDMSIGMVMGYYLLMIGLIGPIQSIVSLLQSLPLIRHRLSRYYDVISYKHNDKQTSPKTDSPLKKLSGTLSFNNITFGYNPTAPPLINNLSFTVKPGQRIAIVGPSGSGKSTIAYLLTGLYKPWEGQLRYDDMSLDDISPLTFSQSVALVNYSCFFFNGSLRDNLTLWDKSISESQLIQATKDACIHDIISNRPGGYDAMIHEGGRNFSGGERQRLEISRALSMNPRLLILDEATSALDAYTEQQIDHHIRRRGCTSIIIAHRLSTIRDADHIIVLDKGCIAQEGSHTTLMANKGTYYNLFKDTESYD